MKIRRAVAAAVVLGAVLMVAAPAGAAKRVPGPTRVLLVGDSITAFYGAYARPALEAKGYKVTVASTGGSSLLDLNVADGTLARALRKSFDPDVVVVEYTGNYQTLPGVATKTPVSAYGSAKWVKQWTTSTKKQTTIYRQRAGVRVLWMQVPQSATTTTNPIGVRITAIIPTLNSIYRTQGPTVDAYTAFGGATYNAALHLPDNLHPNDAGSKLLSNVVVAAVG